MLTYCLTQAHLMLLAWAKLSSMRGQGDVGKLVPVDYTARPSRLFLLDVLIPACMLTYCLTQAHLVLLAWTG